MFAGIYHFQTPNYAGITTATTHWEYVGSAACTPPGNRNAETGID
jgi:hypothetical protein